MKTKILTTTNIKELIEEGFLYQPQNRDWVTNEEILLAAAKMAVKNGVKSANKLYKVLSKECDMSMQIALNNTDIKELLFEAKL